MDVFIFNSAMIKFIECTSNVIIQYFIFYCILLNIAI